MDSRLRRRRVLGVDRAGNDAMAARPMPMGPGGKALGFEYLSRKAHNPGRQKKQRAFYRDAQVIRDFKKLQRTDAAVAAAGSSRDFAKPSKKRAAEAEAAEDAPAPAAPTVGERPKKTKRRKLDPFKKVRDEREAKAAEVRRAREENEAKKAAAATARKEKTKRVRAKGKGKMKAEISSILSTLEASRRR